MAITNELTSYCTATLGLKELGVTGLANWVQEGNPKSKRLRRGRAISILKQRYPGHSNRVQSAFNDLVGYGGSRQ